MRLGHEIPYDVLCAWPVFSPLIIYDSVVNKKVYGNIAFIHEQSARILAQIPTMDIPTSTLAAIIPSSIFDSLGLASSSLRFISIVWYGVIY